MSKRLSEREKWQNLYEEEKSFICGVFGIYPENKYSEASHEKIFDDTLAQCNKAPKAFYQIYLDVYKEQTDDRPWWQKFFTNVPDDDVQERLPKVVEHINRSFEEEAKLRGLKLMPQVKLGMKIEIVKGLVLSSCVKQTHVLIPDHPKPLIS